MNATLAALSVAAFLAAHASNPPFVTSDANAGWSHNGYYVHNNMWNSRKYSPCTQTLSAWSQDKWQVVARMDNKTGDGAVKTYPNVHRDYQDVPIESFDSLTTVFAEKIPHVGIYDVAYDIWINGIARPGCTEIMIWTDNFHQVPGGTYAQDVTMGGHSFKVYATPNRGYIAFVATHNFTSGTLSLLDIMNWVIGNGWLSDKSTLSQICFGIELVSTDDKGAKFEVTGFSISAKLKPKSDRAAPASDGATPAPVSSHGRSLKRKTQ